MKTINFNHLNEISGGLVMMNGAGITVTGESKMTLNGLTLYSNAVCAGNQCFYDIFKDVIKIDLGQTRYNGKSQIAVTATPVQGGALYNIS